MDTETELFLLEQKITELKNKKQQEKEQFEKNNFEFNLNNLSKELDIRKNTVQRNNYGKSYVVSRFQDIKAIPELEAIYNMFNVLHERIIYLEEITSKIEQK